MRTWCNGSHERLKISFLWSAGSSPAVRTKSLLGDRLMVGQRTLTPSIGVRVPVSQPPNQKSCGVRISVSTLAFQAGKRGSTPLRRTKFGSLAQLDSATDFYSVGRGFESLRNRHNILLL